jgi:RNA-splicing ligase RtcB
MPEAYKNVSAIVRIVEENGLASKVAKLAPLGVIKG